MMNWVPYASFAVGLYIGLEFGFRWGQKFMFNNLVRRIKSQTVNRDG